MEKLKKVVSDETMKLKDLIRAVRACKTAADERACITKELANIRTSFKTKKDIETKYRNIAKLMYVDMLGYPTHFGQMEVINLLAKGNFYEKRLGYLALGVLMDENAEVLLLATQAIQNDMKNDSPYIMGLALTAYGNIASDSMASALAQDLETLMKHSNPFVKKKAVCTGIRVLRKVPEVTEDYFRLAVSILEDTNSSHNSLIAAVQLLNEICRSESCTPKILRKMRKQISNAVGRLIELLKSSYDPDHDVSGINDPFLQVHLLQFIRTVIGFRDKSVDTEVVDALTTLATGTESKGAGNAILYECVRTIMSIDERGPHQTLGINILGKFLLNRDNNIRYVALNALCDAVDSNGNAIQRHRNQIKDCLTDPDLTIRYRALDLIYALTNEDNIQELVADLLKYLEMSVSEPDFQHELASKICMVVEKYAPSPRWHIDTVAHVMAKVPSLVMDDTITSAFVIIANTPALQSYATDNLISMAKDVPSDPLRRLAAWCIGEYGDQMALGSAAKYTLNDLVDLLVKFLDSEGLQNETKAYCLTALIKIEAKWDATESLKVRISRIFDNYARSIHLELQQRGVEFAHVLRSDTTPLDVRRQLLKKMPLPSMDKFEERLSASHSKLLSKVGSNSSIMMSSDSTLGKRGQKRTAGDDSSDDSESSYESDDSDSSDDSSSEVKRDSSDDDRRSSKKSGRKGHRKKGGSSKYEEKKVVPKLSGPAEYEHGVGVSSMFDSPKPPTSMNSSKAPLDFGHVTSPEGASASSSTSDPISSLIDFSAQSSGQSTKPPASSADDFLADLLGGSSLSSAPATPARSGSSMSDASSVIPASVAAPTTSAPQFIPYNRNGISITFNFVRSPTPGVVQVEAVFSNSNAFEVSGFVFKVATPKYLTLKIQRASSNVLPAMGQGTASQKFRLVNSMHGTKQIVIKIQVIFRKPDGSEVRDTATIDNFPVL